MKKSRFTETQISQVLKEHEAGKKGSDICRELSISPNTFYLWK
ncbi:transposase, partial [uncultured Weeksella sp.]